MATRPLPPGRRGHGVRGAPAFHQSPPASLLPEKKPQAAPVASGFAAARAVFEAKQKQTSLSTLAPAAAAPGRRRFQPSSPVAAAAAPSKERQAAATPDFSSSTCSTVDSERDRELKDSADASPDTREDAGARPAWRRPAVSEQKQQDAPPTPRSGVKQTIAALEGDAVTTSRPVQRSWAAHEAAGAAPESPVVAVEPPVASNTAETTVQPPPASDGPADEDFHPFRLLMPVENVPVLPSSVACVYDAAAAERQKSIKKVVRKLLHQNKARQDEFKVNARLFGNDFMDAGEYLATLVQDFGGLRTLQLVPGLLSIQPDASKRRSLLLAAKNFRLRNLAALDTECQALRSTAASPVETSVHAVPSVATTEPELVQARAAALEPPSADKTAQEQRSVSKTATEGRIGAHVDVPGGITTPPDAAVAHMEATSTREPAPEPPVFESSPVLLGAADDSSKASTKASEMAITEPSSSYSGITTTTAPCAASDDDDAFQAETLFGERVQPTACEQQRLVSASTTVASVSSTDSLDDAESLFGERLSGASRPSTGAKCVTWGEPQCAEPPPPSPPKPARKPAPAPMIFGAATFGAYPSDSDSDDSDFSD